MNNSNLIFELVHELVLVFNKNYFFCLYMCYVQYNCTLLLIKIILVNHMQNSSFQYHQFEFVHYWNMNRLPAMIPWIYYNHYIYFFWIVKFKYVSIVILCSRNIFFILWLFFVMKIIVAFKCEDSSMVTSSILDFERHF